MEFRGRVLIADVAEALDELSACFPAAPKRCVSSFEQAKEVLRAERFDLVIIGFHFHHSRIFDVLTYVRALEPWHELPIIVVRLRPMPLTAEVRESIQNAVLLLGGDAFIDVGHVTAETFCEVLEQRRRGSDRY